MRKGSAHDQRSAAPSRVAADAAVGKTTIKRRKSDVDLSAQR
jgi:hypothetical protein